MSDKTVYQYTDDSWYEYGCTFCEQPMEVYNAVGWDQNGSAHCLEDLYADILWAHKCKEDDVSIIDIPMYNPYHVLSLEEINRLMDEWDIVVEEVIV